MAADSTLQTTSAFSLVCGNANSIISSENFKLSENPSYLPNSKTTTKLFSQSSAFDGSNVIATKREAWQSILDENVAECVTVVDHDASGNFVQDCSPDSFKSFVSMVPSATDSAYHGNGNVSQTAPLIFPPPVPIGETATRRKAHYHNRHHPQASIVSCYGIPASELKNKSRFSATGVSGKSAVVRDCKMSISSSPPSPSAGSAGGSLCSPVCRSYFKPIAIVPQNIPTAQQNPARNSSYVVVHSPTKKNSELCSTSPTFSSVSCSSRSSTSSLSGASSRKRRADENGQQCFRPSGHSLTNDVIAGVDHVKICDRTSVSPIDHIINPPDWHNIQQPNKRSKNDNEEDDDVIFVSMEPAPRGSKQLNSAPVAEKVDSKSGTVSKRTRAKKPTKKSKKLLPFPNEIDQPRHSSSSTVQASSVGDAQGNTVVTQSHATNAFAKSPAYLVDTVPSVPETKGYFLRSSARKRDVSKTETLASHHSSKIWDSSSSRLIVKYHTRSQRKLKVNAGKSQVVKTHGVAQAPLHVATSQSAVVKPIPIVVDLTNDDCSGDPYTASKSLPRERPASAVHPNSHEQSTSFSKTYEIKGKIGVGGGGVVYAGTRKADNVEVAIKRVPKEKVKRWGKLEGRVVPIEFELLHKATRCRNGGIIRMYDWFERRNSFILVMERPQPVIDLFDYLNQHGAMAEKVAKNIFRQIVEAVIQCHANGVVHRDIKDENVLLNLHTSQAKLIDFGCGTFMKNTPYTEFAGTPEFYPPEWFIDRRYTGCQVDAWSLGVLLYTMVEAQVPFEKEEDIIKCKLRFKRAVGSVSRHCRHLIAAMLQKDPKLRPSLKEVLQHPWFNEDAEVLNSGATSKRSEHPIQCVVDGLTTGANAASVAPTPANTTFLLPAAPSMTKQYHPNVPASLAVSEVAVPISTNTNISAAALDFCAFSSNSVQQPSISSPLQSPHVLNSFPGTPTSESTSICSAIKYFSALNPLSPDSFVPAIQPPTACSFDDKQPSERSKLIKSAHNAIQSTLVSTPKSSRNFDSSLDRVSEKVITFHMPKSPVQTMIISPSPQSPHLQPHQLAGDHLGLFRSEILRLSQDGYINTYPPVPTTPYMGSPKPATAY